MSLKNNGTCSSQPARTDEKHETMERATNLEVWVDRQYFHGSDTRLAVVFGDL